MGEENSKMGFLNRRFGVPLIDGGTVRLPKLIGLSRAMDLILTGRMLDPKEALDWGLANRVCTTGTAYGQAVNLAKEIVKFPQDCLLADRGSAIYAAYDARSREEAMDYETEMFFLQREVILRDLQINELTISVSDMKGKFIKPTLKKVSKYENKFAKLQEKAAKFAFANQLKQSKG